jgi:hypothetical protein
VAKRDFSPGAKPAKPAKNLSESILRITRSGPKETNFAIVDIPGLVRGNQRIHDGYEGLTNSPQAKMRTRIGEQP